MHICMYKYMYTYIAYKQTDVQKYVNTFTGTRSGRLALDGRKTYIHIHVYTYIHIHVYTYTCVHIYMCTCTHVHKHIKR